MVINPIIIAAKMSSADQAWANKLRRSHYPSDRNLVDAHITLFHHLPPAIFPEIKALLASMSGTNPPPAAHISDIMNLGDGTAFRIHSPALLMMRQLLAEHFYTMLIPQDRTEPRLHITIQNKVEPREAAALQAELSRQFAPRSLAITGLSAYYYCGGLWEPIQSWSFRG
jgi:hypothetical protein